MSMMVSPYALAVAGGGGPPFSSVVFLSGFEGTDGSSSFTDESSYARAMTAVGNAQVDTAQFKFGSASALFDGSGDIITLADSADFEFGSGEFTVEGWFRFSGISGSFQGNAGLVGHGQIGTPNLSWVLRLTTSPAAGISFEVSTDGASTGLTTVTGAYTFSINTWYFIAADRDSSGKIRIYVGTSGTASMVASGTVTASLYNSPATVAIGRYSYGGFNRDFWGWADEIRITKGYARYASDSGAPVPTAAFPRS